MKKIITALLLYHTLAAGMVTTNAITNIQRGVIRDTCNQPVNYIAFELKEGLNTLYLITQIEKDQPKGIIYFMQQNNMINMKVLDKDDAKSLFDLLKTPQ